MAVGAHFKMSLMAGPKILYYFKFVFSIFSKDMQLLSLV